MLLIKFTSLLILILASQCDAKPTSRLLAEHSLLSMSYDEIHRISVLDQIEHYVPAQKSLHTRHTQPLDGIFDFCLDNLNKGFSEEWFSNSLKSKCHPKNFYRIPVPSAFNDITSNRTVRDYIGWFWYQREISPKSFSADWNWFIQFESINYLSIVWIQQIQSNMPDAQFLGSHVSNLPFIFNVTHLASNQSENIKLRVTIAVNNKLTQDTIPSGSMTNLTKQVGHEFYRFQPDFDFYHFSGIMGSVNLIRLPRIHIAQVDMIRMNELDQLRFNVCLSDLNNEEVIVKAMLKPTDGSTAREAQKTFLNQQCNVIEFETEGLESWSLANGNLNHFAALNTVGFRVVSLQDDLFELKTGIKSKTHIDAKFGLVVDGIMIQLQGFGTHHEQLFSGRAMSESAIMKDIYLLKDVGANVVRTSHYPYSVDYLDACDENGIMLIAECPAVGLKTFSEVKLILHKQLLLEMMQRDNHHPSIIAWSIANEPLSQLEVAEKYFESLTKYARQELAQYTTGAGRPLTAALAESASADKVGQFLDMIMINRYYGWYGDAGVVEAIRLPLTESLTNWASKHPGKPLMISEFGADTVAGEHSASMELFTEEFQRDLLVEFEHTFNEIVGNRSLNGINFWGSMIWNFADFSTHNSILRVVGNRKGLYTKDRRPKLSTPSVKKIYLDRLKLVSTSSENCLT